MTARGLAIRDATAADVDRVAVLLEREARFLHRLDPYFELRPDFDWPGRVGRILARSDLRLVVAEQGGDLVGFVYARVVRPPASRPSRLDRLLRRPRPTAGPLEPAVWGVIEGCWVEEGARRRGLGRRLVARAEAWLRGEGAEQLRLGVAAANIEAQRFWQALGFRPYRLRYLREL